GEPARLPGTSHIRLGGLARAEVAKLLQTSPVIERLYEQSGGNPHHLEELLLSLPSEVEDLFLQRTRRMPPAARACLGALATLGRPADTALLSIVADLSEADVEETIAGLCESRVV